MHKTKELTVAEITDWLRDNPNAEWVARHDMIVRLRELKEKLNLNNQNDENHTTKIK